MAGKVKHRASDGCVDVVRYRARGAVSIVQPHDGQWVDGARNVTVKERKGLDAPWRMRWIEGTVGESREAQYADGAEGEASSISLKEISARYSVSGHANISGHGEIDGILGYGTVRLKGRDREHRLVVGAEVSTWRYMQGVQVSTIKMMEEIDVSITVKPYGNGGTLTTTAGKRIPLASNDSWTRNAEGRSFIAENCDVMCIEGYRNVTLKDVVAFDVTGGTCEQDETDSIVFTERREENDNLEFPYFRFYLLHDEEHDRRSSFRRAASATGKAILKGGCVISGFVEGYETVLVENSSVEGEIRGGFCKQEGSSREKVKSSGYHLYKDSGTARERKTVTQESRGRISITKDSVVQGLVSGYHVVEVTDSTGYDFSWALYDDALGARNGSYRYASDTVYSGDCAETTRSVAFELKHGGQITVKNSCVADLTGYQTVSLDGSEAGRIFQDMQECYTGTEQYGVCSFRPVYGGYEFYEGEDASLTDASASVAGDAFNPVLPGFWMPNVVESASGRVSLRGSVVAGGIEGYRDVVAKDSVINGGITGGCHTEKKGSKTDSLAGCVSLENVELDGWVEGYSTVKMANVVGSDTQILCGSSKTKADGTFVARLSGRVTLKNSRIAGDVHNALAVMLKDSEAGGILADASARMNITMNGSVVTGNVDGGFSLTASGGNCIGGYLRGDGTRDSLTVNAKSSLEIGGDLEGRGGEDSFLVRKNGALFVHGDLLLDKKDKVKVNGELVLYGDGSLLWDCGCLKGNGVVCLTEEYWKDEYRHGASGFQGRVYDIGTADVAAAFRGVSVERADNAPSGVVDLISWMGDADERKGWLCGHENVYYIMDGAGGTGAIAAKVYDPGFHPDWFFPLEPKYLTDKEDWFSLDLTEAREAGWSSLAFSDNVNVYAFGDRWFDVLDAGELLDINALCEAHAGDTLVSVCVAVKGRIFSSPGSYTVALTKQGI